MRIFKRGKAIRLSLKREIKRDFAKKRKERQVWRPQTLDVLLDLP